VSALRVEELPSPVTLLADALDACAGLVVDIEIKNAPTEPGFDPAERAARALPAAIAAARSLRGVVVSSFATASLDAARDAARARGDELRLGWLVAPDVNPSTVVEQAAARGYQCLHPFVSWVDPALVQRARRHSLALHVWTVNAADDLTSMFDLGVDALITDRPAEALALRRSRRDAP
jgi:glycerophosphoryl diester phosphodiesterase